MSAVARRYARAAVVAAAEEGGVDAVEALTQGLRAFRRVYRQSRELREVILNPALKASRDAVLDAVFAELEVAGHTRNLLKLLADRDRICVLDGLVVEVEAIADERAGRRRAYVTAPIELVPSQLDRIGRALQTRFGCPVVVSAEIDPDMIGGLVCRVGDVTLDHSVRRQLEILHEKLEAEAF